MNTRADTEQVTVPKAAEALSKGKSMQDIADMLAANTMKMRRQTTPNEGNTPEGAPVDETDDAGETDALDLDTGVGDSDESDDASGTALDDSAGTGDDDDAGEEEENARESDDDDNDDALDDQDADQATFEIDDDDLLELDDGTQVSIAALKEVFKADETIAQAVEQQKEATNEALTMRARAQEDTAKAQGAINAMFKHVVDVVAVPLVPPPNEADKQNNPQQYIRHLDAYQQDQQRIQQAQQDLAGAVEAYSQQQTEFVEARKKEEMNVLISKIPALQSAKTRPQASQDILDAASFYGFSPDEVNNAIDHRIYQLAYDAQQYRKLMKATGKDEVDLTLEKAKTKVRQTRTLRSRGTTAKTRVSGQAKRVLKAKTRAQSTGKAKDVAAFLAAKRQQP